MRPTYVVVVVVVVVGVSRVRAMQAALAADRSVYLVRDDARAPGGAPHGDRIAIDRRQGVAPRREKEQRRFRKGSSQLRVIK